MYADPQDVDVALPLRYLDVLRQTGLRAKNRKLTSLRRISSRPKRLPRSSAFRILKLCIIDEILFTYIIYNAQITKSSPAIGNDFDT
jgi:hypothetical protein